MSRVHLRQLVLGLLIPTSVGGVDVVIVASVIQAFHLTPYAVARSLASQQMGEDEQGRSTTTLLFTLY